MENRKKKAALNMGAELKRRRVELGYTQEDLAHAAGMSTSAYQVYESSTTRVGRPLVESKIARALRWPADAFDLLRAGVVPVESETATPAIPIPINSADPLEKILAKLEEMDNRYGDLDMRVDALSQEHGQVLLRVGQLERKVGVSTR